MAKLTLVSFFLFFFLHLPLIDICLKIAWNIIKKHAWPSLRVKRCLNMTIWEFSISWKSPNFRCYSSPHLIYDVGEELVTEAILMETRLIIITGVFISSHGKPWHHLLETKFHSYLHRYHHHDHRYHHHSFFHGGGVLIFTLLLPPCRRRVNSYTHPPHRTERREGGREGGREEGCVISITRPRTCNFHYTS